MTKKARKIVDKAQNECTYARIEKINGRHPLKEKAPFSYVEYRARRRKNGNVLYFNFILAKEMGIIPKDHPHYLNPQLKSVLLDTFGLIIINEYDMLNNVKINENEVMSNSYMATRYLQLQHPGNKGVTSGDGRSIWNGLVRANGVTWDISSCGTGATCLSPAVAHKKKFFRSGDPTISYGCGYSDLSDGVSAALLSEIFNYNGLETERTLCLIEYRGQMSINVRAHKNLLRPSHFFNHLKQSNYIRLKSIVDYFIERQEGNKTWKSVPQGDVARYRYMLKEIVKVFAQAAATFESEYIFCWLDWDGDNILMDGGIIDYGSVRQFGLFHYEYRYDDVERWSTNIIEQKGKAKYIVQTFAQLSDFLITKQKKNIKNFANDDILSLFDKIFFKKKLELFVKKLGFSGEQVAFLLDKKIELVNDLYQVFTVFEKEKSPDGIKPVADGVNCNAVNCMRDILRELPGLLRMNYTPIGAEQFLEIMRSDFVEKVTSKISKVTRDNVNTFQQCYIDCVEAVAKNKKVASNTILLKIEKRACHLNRYERITGDAIVHVANKVIKQRKTLENHDFHQLLEAFIEDQILIPEKKALYSKKRGSGQAAGPRKIQGTLLQLLRIVHDLREGL